MAFRSVPLASQPGMLNTSSSNREIRGQDLLPIDEANSLAASRP